MSDREKLLGLVVGGLLAFFAFFGVFRGVQNGIRVRNTKIAALDRNIQKEQDAKLQALQDQNLVREFKLRSLDANPNKAHLAFSHWLENQVAQVGLDPKEVRYNNIGKSTDDYKELKYTVTGDGNIKQITELLYRIQAADTLHRVERFSILQASKSNKLKLDMSIAALSMGNVNGTKATVGEIVESKLGESLDDYTEAIVVRNMFAPANNAPKFDEQETTTIELGKQLDWAMKAADADGHALSFRLVDSPEESATMKNRNLVWKPTELGEYEFKIEVEDDGVPSKKAVATVHVKVVPEKVAKAKAKDDFDEATVTKLTGFVQGPTYAGPKIWLYVQSEDENLTLGVGDKIDIGKWRGVVKFVKPDRNVAWLESEDGQSFELALGQVLAEATPVDTDDRL